MRLRDMASYGAAMFASGKATLDELKQRGTVEDADDAVETWGKLGTELREGVAILKMAIAAFAGVLSVERDEPPDEDPGPHTIRKG